MIVTADQLRAVCTALGNAKAEEWTGPLNAALFTIEADTPERAADFMAQWAHESAEFTRLEESLNYSAEGLLRVFPRYFDAVEAGRYANHPEAIANLVYANRMGNGDELSGDGWKYRGRGLPMITGRDNYRALSIAICASPETLIARPELLLIPDYAMAAAAWYWGARELNDLADRGDFDGISDIVNFGRKTAKQGDANGYADRAKYRARARLALKLPA